MSAVRVRVGAVDIMLRTELPEVREEFSRLYPVAASGPVDDRTIRVEVRRTRSWLPGPRRYAVSRDGETTIASCRSSEVLPHLEWAINAGVIARHAEFLQIHAAAFARAGQGMIIAGRSGAGKSTLAAALLARGWEYRSDEFALIDRKTARLDAFPKALNIKAGAFELVEGLSLGLICQRKYVRALKGRLGFIAAPRRCEPYPPVPVRYVLFTRHTPGTEPRLRRISPARAVITLLGHTINAEEVESDAIALLTRVTRGAQCFRLDAGALEPTCRLLERLVAASGAAPAA
jgi:HprK-related kinase A